MSWFHGLRHRIRTVLHPTEYERELRDEMGFHESLDAQQERDPSRARRRFGNRTYYQEETREMTWLRWLDVLRQDLGYAWRSVRRTPGFTAMVVVTLALGLGVNAATFTLLDALYLRPPAGIHDPETVRRVWFESSGSRSADGKRRVSSRASYPMFAAVAGAAADPRSVAAYEDDNALRLGRNGRGPRLRGIYASANYFTVLGVHPVVGRLYTASEDSLGQPANVVLLGHRFWQQELGGDTAVLGTNIDVGTKSYTVVGILPPEFTGLDLQAADAWFPLAGFQKGRWWESGTSWRFVVIQRAQPGPGDQGFTQRASLAVRESNVRVYPTNPDTLMNVLTGSIVEAQGPGDLGQDMIISSRLSGVAVIVLLIACANVINLLLARAVQRRRELAVRLALGISRSRLIRLLTTETVLLAVIAGVGAIVAAWLGGALLRGLLFPDVEFHESALHWRVVLFASGVTLACGLVAGLIPAVQASKPDLTRALKDGVRDGSVHRSRLRNALIVAQAALSIMLLVGAALFVRSLSNVRGLDLGYDANRIVFGSARFDPGQAPPDAVLAASVREIADRLRSRPGVEGVALTTNIPMYAISFMTFYWGADSSQSIRGKFPTFQSVSPEFFQTVGVRLLRGRTFEDRHGGPRQMMVNDAMAKQLWPGGNAIGQCMRFEERDGPCYTLVGVVENARRSSVIEEPDIPMYYLPQANMPEPGWEATWLVVRARADAIAAAGAEMASALRTAFPTAQPSIIPMTQNLEPEYRPWRLGAMLFTGFGMLALIVAVIGVYSSVSYGVAQRAHEFGVRMALGARVADVLRQVIAEGLRVVAIGIVAGIALALATGKLISALLYGVEPGDPGVMLLVSAVLLLVAAFAALVPAWRASRVDPVVALRSD